mmetsp:Transcript_36797/g.44514  ORF Transcript_36797/g.44514 Transcript_36797/m.44514 type:complete len:224 (-) Transcript_36797:334-1005(-)
MPRKTNSLASCSGEDSGEDSQAESVPELVSGDEDDDEYYSGSGSDIPDLVSDSTSLSSDNSDDEDHPRNEHGGRNRRWHTDFPETWGTPLQSCNAPRNSEARTEERQRRHTHHIRREYLRSPQSDPGDLGTRGGDPSGRLTELRHLTSSQAEAQQHQHQHQHQHIHQHRQHHDRASAAAEFSSLTPPTPFLREHHHHHHHHVTRSTHTHLQITNVSLGTFTEM